jgi:hypothetical protein
MKDRADRRFLVMYVAVPGNEAEGSEGAAGAYVNCWINAGSESEAIRRASREVHDAGWVIEELRGVRVVTQADYAEGDPNLEYFEQALIDDEVLAFHTWPIGSGE